MRRILLVLFVFCAVIVNAQIKVCDKAAGGIDFPLCTDGKVSNIFVSDADHEVVKRVANIFADDICLVTGKKGKVTTSKSVKGKNIVIIGTLGKNAVIDDFVQKGFINVEGIKNGWEQYVVKVLDNPRANIDRALVIAGCDRRGTAYGVFAISEAMGVSPLYWWSDIPVKKSKSLFVQTSEYISKAPSVKYRGLFINDEGWGITPWAKKTYDPELGDIGPKTYAKVCELILRMKGNMLSPAMHPGSGAFNKYPENKIVADNYAIVMTSAHCEPLLFNNVTEWDKKTMGDWNYMTNKGMINKVLDKRISENGPYENFYTLAMRGIHDSGLIGVPKDKEVSLIEEVLGDQRDILAKHINKPIDSIPQLFMPYKEVLDIYKKGLKVPEDVTLVWPDDNFGYIKRLSNSEERKRKGGAGVYYHISYCGAPHDYLWINTTPNTLIFEEMRKAYDTGADRYWLLNVGDIKPGELALKYFFDMAWDVDYFNFENSYDFNTNYLTSIFGEKYREDLKDILDTYFLLGFQHKPESMGWGYLWNNYQHMDRVIDTDFSLINYSEAEDRMNEYDRISDKSEKIWKSLPEELKAPFYELVHYQVKGAALMNKKMLTAQKNRWYARQNRAATNLYADKTKLFHDSLDYYTKEYNTMLNGKWNHMITVSPGWKGKYQNMPPIEKYQPKHGEDMQVFIPGKDCTLGLGAANVLPTVNPFVEKKLFVELYNRGDKAFSWEATANMPWVKLSKKTGTTLLQERIDISVDWAKVPTGDNLVAEIEFKTKNKVEKVILPVFNPQTPTVAEIKGLYVEDNGCVSINAGKFHRKQEANGVKVRTVMGLGYENECVQLGEATQETQSMWNTHKVSQAQYDFYSFNGGNVVAYIYALPLFPVDPKHDTRYGVMVDDGLVHWVTVSSKEYSGEWHRNVFRNSAIATVKMHVGKPGKHTFKLICADPGMIIQKVVLDFGGMKQSYLGPKVTMVE